MQLKKIMFLPIECQLILFHYSSFLMLPLVFLKNRKFFDTNSNVIILNKEHSIDIDEPIDLELARVVGKEKIKFY